MKIFIIALLLAGCTTMSVEEKQAWNAALISAFANRRDYSQTYQNTAQQNLYNLQNSMNSMQQQMNNNQQQYNNNLNSSLFQLKQLQDMTK